MYIYVVSYNLYPILFKENAKTASYGLVIVVGVGVTGVIAYTVLNVRSISQEIVLAN